MIFEFCFDSICFPLQDAERKKQLELQRLKKPDRETVAKRIESMKKSKMMELQRKMLGDEERLMMLNAFKAEQRKHLDELHKQSKMQDDAVSHQSSGFRVWGSGIRVQDDAVSHQVLVFRV